MYMRRKIVQQGAATLMVSLPASWTRQNGLKKGMEVEIEENGPKLTVGSSGSVKSKKLEIDVTGVDEYMLRFIVSIYKSGYDEVKLTFKDPKTIGLIQQSIGKEISAFEIVEQGKNYCILQDIEGIKSEGFEVALKRTFFLLLQMAEESVPIMKIGKYDELKPLRFLEEGNNRFTTYCRRALSKKGYSKPEKLQFVYLLVDRLEKIADEYKFLFDHLMKNKGKKISPAVLKEYENTNKLMRMFYEYFYSGHREDVHKMSKIRKDVISKCQALHEKANSFECMVIHYIITICQFLFDNIEIMISIKY